MTPRRIRKETSPQKTEPFLSPDWYNVFVLDGVQQERPKTLRRMKGDTPHYEEIPQINKLHGRLFSFCTGSKYEGDWNALGFTGKGVYTFPQGIVYVGEFRDGRFHGSGEISFSGGQKCVEADWKNGMLNAWRFKFEDDLVCYFPWDYCTMPDRRFWIENVEGLLPPGDEYLTNEQPTRTLPEYFYDTCYGFYDIRVGCVVSADDKKTTIAYPTEEEKEFIEKYYRKWKLEHAGYRPEFYEYWTAGTRKEIKEILDKYYPPPELEGMRELKFNRT